MTSTAAPVSSIRNLGPAMEAACARAGIHNAETLHALGPDETYRRLLLSGSRPHFIGYYVLVMGLQGRPWNDCKGSEKAALRLRFDVIKANSFDKGLSDFEAALDAIGVIRQLKSAHEISGGEHAGPVRQAAPGLQPTNSRPEKK